MRLGRMMAALVGIGLSAPLCAAWYEVRAPHFIIYSQGSADAIRKFVTDLEDFDQATRKLLNRPDVDGDDPNPVTIFTVDTVASIVKLCKAGKAKEEASKACKYLGGFYDGRAEGSVAFVPRGAGSGSSTDIDARTILFHEYAHHLMFANSLAVYPAWYVEGFAEFLSNVKLDRPGEVGIGRIAGSRAFSLLVQRAIPVREILTADPSSLSPDDRLIFYGRAWLLTHYLTLGTRRDDQLARYLIAINKGQTNAEAATAAFGDLDILNKEVERYMQARLSYLPVKISSIPPAKIRIRRLSAGEEALMPVRLQSRRSVDDDSAPAVASEARRLAAPWPADPGVQLILAEAEFDAGNDDAAEAAADRALAADPGNGVAMIFKARAIMHRAETQNRYDNATWRSARGWLLKANRIENDAAWPLILFYRSFVQQGSKPTENAVKALERGFILAPQDDSVRMMLVYQLLRDKRVEEAQAVLTPLAFHPHAPADNGARRLLDRIKERGADALSGWTIPTIAPAPLELPPGEPAPKTSK